MKRSVVHMRRVVGRVVWDGTTFRRVRAASVVIHVRELASRDRRKGFRHMLRRVQWEICETMGDQSCPSGADADTDANGTPLVFATAVQVWGSPDELRPLTTHAYVRSWHWLDTSRDNGRYGSVGRGTVVRVDDLPGPDAEMRELQQDAEAASKRETHAYASADAWVRRECAGLDVGEPETLRECVKAWFLTTPDVDPPSLEALAVWASDLEWYEAE